MPEYKRLKYNGKHCRIRLLLFVLLDALAMSEGAWSSGRYYSLPDLKNLGVEDLRYHYLKTRLSRLHEWRYLERRVVTPKKGRSLWGYRLGQRGQDEITKAPEDVYEEALGKVLAALPGLGPSVKPAAPPPVRKQPGPRPVHTTPKDDVNVSTESDFQPDAKTMYCLKSVTAGELSYYCGLPGRQCQLYETLPAGAVILSWTDWNRTRQRPG